MLQALALRLANLPLLLPVRAYRIALQLVNGLVNLFSKNKNPLGLKFSIYLWWAEFTFVVLDFLLVPDIYETLTDLFKKNTRQLTLSEIEVAKSIFKDAIDYRRVRMDERAGIVCQRHHIIYVSFHTINSWGSYRPDILIHELVHVWQYRAMGAIYIPRALYAQYTPEGYNYGGVKKLKECLARGGSLLDFNLEQQADIVSDYYRIREGMMPCWGNGSKADLTVYEKFMGEIWK